MHLANVRIRFLQLLLGPRASGSRFNNGERVSTKSLLTWPTVRGVPSQSGGWRTPLPPSSHVPCTVRVVIRAQIRVYPCALKRRMAKERIRERKREKEKEEMGKGTLGGVGYVLSACVPLYSSYCITGLALLPHSRPFSRARNDAATPSSTSNIHRGCISQCTPFQNA